MSTRKSARIKTVGLSVLLAAGVLAWSARGYALGPQELGQGTNDYITWDYFDFTATAGAGHDGTHANFAFQSGNPVNYSVIQFSTTAATSQCFEVNTQAPRFYPTATGDTRFWLLDSSTGNYKSLNDDSGGTLWSRARIWLDINANATLFVAAFSSSSNSIHFDVQTHRLNLSEADCTTNQSLPWFKTFNGGSNQFSANAS